MVAKRITPLPSERAALVEAVGRVLRADGAAAWDLPMADNSAMDGFALRSKDTEEPVNLRLLAGNAYAGSGTPPPVEPGEAPMNISSIKTISVAGANFDTGNVLNPAVLEVTA